MMHSDSRTARRSLTSTLAILWTARAIQVALAGTSCLSTQAKTGGACPNSESPGVLITCTIPDGVDGGTFQCYVNILLRQTMPYVMIAAVVLVIFSGIQYMTAQGNSSEATKAKQRIIGVLSGLAFYAALTYLVPLIAAGLNIGNG